MIYVVTTCTLRSQLLQNSSLWYVDCYSHQKTGVNKLKFGSRIEHVLPAQPPDTVSGWRQKSSDL